MLFGDDDVTLAVILGVDDDPALPVLIGINGNLDFGVRVHANIEDLSMAGEPGIRPATVITDTDGSDAVEDK
jgi:hypothetical protein